jgi:hypothetical protein
VSSPRRRGPAPASIGASEAGAAAAADDLDSGPEDEPGLLPCGHPDVVFHGAGIFNEWDLGPGRMTGPREPAPGTYDQSPRRRYGCNSHGW